MKGKRQVGCITSADRGILSTACMCISASGYFLPPMLIFPRKRLTEQLKKGAPIDSIFSCNDSGWMTASDFNIWFDHFLRHTRPTSTSPILLLLDGHSTHVQNLKFVEKAHENNVTVICFPPHCSHKLQPLDVAFMGPFKTNFSQAVEMFLKNNPGRTVTLNDISSLVGNAFSKTSVPSTAINGFKKCGIVPYNRSIFNETDFAPSMVTDVPMKNDSDDTTFGIKNEIEANTSCYVSTSASQKENSPTADTKSIDECASSSRVEPDMDRSDLGQILSFSEQLTMKKAFNVPPEEILPLPKNTGRNTTRNRKRGKTAIITESPYRKNLQNSLASKDINTLQKGHRKQLKMKSEALSETTKRGRRCSKGTKIKKVDSLQDSLCEICGNLFSNSNEGRGWHKCQDCNTWFHDCNGVHCLSCQ